MTVTLRAACSRRIKRLLRNKVMIPNSSKAFINLKICNGVHEINLHTSMQGFKEFIISKKVLRAIQQKPHDSDITKVLKKLETETVQVNSVKIDPVSINRIIDVYLLFESEKDYIKAKLGE